MLVIQIGDKVDLKEGILQCASTLDPSLSQDIVKLCLKCDMHFDIEAESASNVCMIFMIHFDIFNWSTKLNLFVVLIESSNFHVSGNLRMVSQIYSSQMLMAFVGNM